MEKRYYWALAIFFVIFSKSAAAQDIVIGEKTYPLYILVPLILVLFAWVIIFLAWLARNFNKVSLVLFNIGKLLAKFGVKLRIRKPKEELKTEKKEELEVEEEAKKKKVVVEEVKRDLTPFVEKIEEIEYQLPKLKEEVVFKRLTSVIHDFFATLMSLRYEFTDEELVEVLEKKKKNLVAFAKKVSDLKYGGKPVTRAELIKLIDEFKHIVKQYVKAGWRPKRVTRGVIEKLVEQDKKIFENIRYYVDFLQHESRKRQIESILEDETNLLKKNIKELKKTYNKILSMYVQLSPKEKAAVYPELLEFYNNANKAIFSTIYGEKSKKQLEYFVRELRRLRDMPRKEPLLLRIKRFFARPPQLPPQKPVPVKEVTTEKIPTTGPLFEKLVKVFKPEEFPEKKVKVLLKPKKVEQPSKAPFLSKIKRIFKRKAVPTKKVELVKKEKKPEALFVERAAVAEAKEKEALVEIGRLLAEAPKVEKVDYAAKIKELITKAESELASGKIEAAETIYNEIKLNYSRLEKNEQEALYKPIIDLYNSIRKAEEQRTTQTKEKVKEKEEQKKERALSSLEQEELKLLLELEKMKRGL